MVDIETLIKLYSNHMPKKYLGDFDDDTFEHYSLESMVNPQLDFVEQIREWSNEKLCQFILKMGERSKPIESCVNWNYSEVRILEPDNVIGVIMTLESVSDACNILCAMRGITPLYDAGC